MLCPSGRTAHAAPGAGQWYRTGWGAGGGAGVGWHAASHRARVAWPVQLGTHRISAAAQWNFAGGATTLLYT